MNKSSGIVSKAIHSDADKPSEFELALPVIESLIVLPVMEEIQLYRLKQIYKAPEHFDWEKCSSIIFMNLWMF